MNILSGCAHHTFNKLSQILNIDVLYFVKGGFWIGFNYVFVTLLRLALISILAYAVDVDFYGKYQFILTLISIASVFSLPGMDLAITQSVARGYESSLIFGTKTKIKWGIFGSLFLAGAALFFKFVHPENFWFVFILAAFFLPFTSFSSVIAYYRGKENFKQSAFYSMIGQSSHVFATILAILLVKSLLAIVVAMMSVSIAVYGYFYFKEKKSIKKKKFDKTISRYGKDLTFMTFLEYLMPYADKLIITFFAGFTGLAVYAIAIAITTHLSISGKLISFLILPKLSRAKPHHTKKINQIMWASIIVTLITMAILALTLPWLIPLLFSQKYVESVLYAQIALGYLVFFLPSSILYSYFLARKKTKLLYAYNVGVGVLNLVLLGVFVPLLGILGAVIGKVALGFLGFVFLTTMFYSQHAKV